MANCTVPLGTLSYQSYLSYLGLKRTSYATRVKIPCLTCCPTYTPQVRQLGLLRQKVRVDLSGRLSLPNVLKKNGGSS